MFYIMYFSVSHRRLSVTNELVTATLDDPEARIEYSLISYRQSESFNWDILSLC